MNYFVYKNQTFDKEHGYREIFESLKTPKNQNLYVRNKLLVS